MNNAHALSLYVLIVNNVPNVYPMSIAAEQAQADSDAITDWGRIVGRYDLLMRVEPSPVVELNRAVAVAMKGGPAAGRWQRFSPSSASSPF